jgi:UDP-glucose 4-epimerase
MKVLILGGAGFLGSNLVRRCLSEKSCQVTVLDSLDPLMHSNTQNLQKILSKIRFIRGDIRNETLLADVVQNQDVIFNCAAQTSHSMSIRYPLLDAEINCLGNLKVLEAVRLFNKDAIIVYTSTSTVIGKQKDIVADEFHPERPVEIYSANKGVAEKYFQIYNMHYDLKTVVLRLPNLYGPGGKNYAEFGFMNYFIDLAWKNQQIKIFGKGAQSRNTMFVEDATDILWKVVNEPRLFGNMYFATGTEHLTVREITEMIVGVFQKGSINYIDWPDERRRIEVGPVRLSSARLRNLVDWEPRYDLESGLLQTKAVFEQNGF